jgi:hypothetical protein
MDGILWDGSLGFCQKGGVITLNSGTSVRQGAKK